MIYAKPTSSNSIISLKSRYKNFIGGKWIEPHNGDYLPNYSPVDGKVYCEIPKSQAIDVEEAISAAEKAQASWGKTSITERSNLLFKIADRIEKNIEKLSLIESWDNGKPVRETLNADLPLVVDHFRYFAGCLRAEEGSLSSLDSNTMSYHIYEPIGIVGQIIPWKFPLLMAAWKLAPALAAGNSIILKASTQTPVSILVLMEMIEDLIPSGVVNVINGSGSEVGKAITDSNRIGKIAFTGSTKVAKMNLPPKVTERAFERLAEIGAANEGMALRIAVAGGGCSGFQYDILLDTETEGDLVLKGNGQAVVVDSTSLPFLHNAVIDFSEELIGARFTIENPNATSSCGCGTSFSI
jgi:iron-sulfur cluster assembly accessory protein